LEPSELFSHGNAVSFYLKDEDGFEVLLGVGSVMNIQDDERILVVMEKATDGHEEAIHALMNNDKRLLERLRVKPSIPHVELARLMAGGENV
jgi:hypothetical protein